MGVEVSNSTLPFQIYIYIYFKCHSLEIVKSWMVGQLVGCCGLGHTILEVKKIACPLFHDLT